MNERVTVVNHDAFHSKMSHASDQQTDDPLLMGSTHGQATQVRLLFYQVAVHTDRMAIGRAGHPRCGNATFSCTGEELHTLRTLAEHHVNS